MRAHIPFYLSKSGLLATFIAAAFSPYAFALTPAGKVDFAFGKATATGTDGATRPLAKGTEIYSGDAITTTDGRVQIRFTDGAFMALQPNTIFKVDQYAFDGKSDGKEKGSFNLVKGSLRTVTGLIGKVNKANYEVRTPTATIGIRGTAYSATQTDDGLVVSVAQGLVSVSNSGGNVTLSTGQSVLVKSPTSSPEMTDQKAAADQIISERKQQEEAEQEVVTERPINTDTVNAAGDQRTADGGPLALATSGPKGGTGYAVASSDGSSPSIENNSTTTFSGNSLTGFTSSYNYSVASPSQVKNAGWNGLIGWGRWTGEVVAGGGESFTDTYGANEGLHYVAGVASTVASLNLGSNAVVTYNLSGATNPTTTYSNSNPSTAGSFQGIGGNPATAQVTFSASPTMKIYAQVVTNNYTYNLSSPTLSLGISGSSATFGGSTSIAGASGSASLSYNGLFAGSSGQSLGIVYSINDSQGSTGGAAVFTKP